jgi:hypothetical protein
LPGADDPTDLLVDPVQYANKVADMEQQTAVIDTDLVMFATQPAPSESEVPPPSDGGLPPRAKVAVTGYSQGDRNWCVPASTATTLSAFGISSSVSALANEEARTSDPNYKVGTHLSKAAKALRRRVSRIYYAFDHSTSPRDLLHMVAYDIGKYSAPVIVAVWTPGLSYWASASKQGFHAVTVYLYHTSSGGGFKLYDSNFDNRYAVSLAELSSANHNDLGELVW